MIHECMKQQVIFPGCLNLIHIEELGCFLLNELEQIFALIKVKIFNSFVILMISFLDSYWNSLQVLTSYLWLDYLLKGRWCALLHAFVKTAP